MLKSLTCVGVVLGTIIIILLMLKSLTCVGVVLGVAYYAPATQNLLPTPMN